MRSNDPLPSFNFYVTLADTTGAIGTVLSLAFDYWVAGFSECSGLDASLEIFEYKEGGANDFVHKFATRASFSNIVLRHGVIFQYDDLWTWHNEWVRGSGKRKDGVIVLRDESRTPAKVWRFKRGIPTKWTGPVLNAMQSSVAIESLEIAHEGLEQEVGA